MDQKSCPKCGKVMSETQFYMDHHGNRMDLCKKCLTMHVDNFDEKTYVWLLEKADVPYIPEIWTSIRTKEYSKNPFGMTGTSVFGKYLAQMRLKQYHDYNYADSEKAEAEYLAKHDNVKPEKIDPAFEQEMRERLDAGDISQAQYQTLVSTETQHLNEPIYGAPDPQSATSFHNEQDYMPADELPDPAADLSEDDKTYLAMKWGRLYKPDEWVELEKKYTEMKSSFDIQDSDTEGTLILICKTYLKMNQAVDIGDMDGFQKLSRVYDSLRKSAKFTAAQNKDEKNDFVDSVGELVAMCERESGFIPRYATDIPQDIVDRTLEDMNNYTYKLVTQDLGFGQQIEDALKKIQIQKEMDAEENSNDVTELDDFDMETYLDDQQDQKDQDLLIEIGGDLE